MNIMFQCSQSLRQLHSIGMEAQSERDGSSPRHPPNLQARQYSYNIHCVKDVPTSLGIFTPKAKQKSETHLLCRNIKANGLS